MRWGLLILARVENRARFFGIGGRRGFVLFEVLLAVTIFSFGVLALGRCVERTLAADLIRAEEERASRALANALVQVEAGAVKSTGNTQEELKGRYAGMELKTSRVLLKEKNEKNQELSGVYRVTLEVSWSHGGERLSRELSFYHAPRQ